MVTAELLWTGTIFFFEVRIKGKDEVCKLYM
jgi:hypothetical protein